MRCKYYESSGRPMLAFLTASLLVLSTATAAERFGGIEIGAKGVKVSAIEVDQAGEKPQLKVLSLDKKTVDVTLSRLKGKNFSEVKIEDVVDVVKNFQTALTDELSVPPDHIQVVASSGVPFADNFGDLVIAIKDATGAELSKIDARVEATLTNLALVPKDWRVQALVVDVGSGNTKGGLFLDDSGTAGKFVVLDAPFGTATLSKAMDEEAQTTGKPRAAVVQQVARTLVGQPLRKQLSETPELSQRQKILFSGGSVWAAMTIMRPETALDPFPEVRAADLQAYAQLLARNPGGYPEIDFASISDPAVRGAAQADYDRIRGAMGSKAIFTPEELQAGAALLNEVASSLKFNTKAVYFDRKAVTAWITAFITPEELRDLLPNALGRELPTTPLLTKPEVSSVETAVTPMQPRPSTVPQIQREQAIPVSVIPIGLSMRAADLLAELSVFPTQDAREAAVYTPNFCVEMGAKCYRYGRFQDALAFAKHAAQVQESPTSLYLQGLSELALNQTDDAAKTAKRLRSAGGSSLEVIGPLRDRLNGPRASRLVQMIDGR